MASSSTSTSESMSEITVKTLDGKNRTFVVPDNLTIRQFKEKISGSIEISANTQRLIFQGRVMQDEKVLKDYDVNGKVIHLVQRAPPSTLSGSSASTSSTTTSTSSRPPSGRPQGHVIHVGRVQQQPSSREARARLRQAEFNLGIINDALHLLEQRTGISPENLPGPDENELRREDDMDSTSATPASVDAQSDNRGSGATATEGGQQQTGSGSGSGSAPSTAAPDSSQDNSLTATELADFLDRVLRTNNRMVPHLRLYRNYLRSEENYPQASRDRQHAQETVNRVNEALHAMSHMMHSLSDVMVNMGTQHPRQALANPVSPFTSLPTMSIPLHMNIRARPNGNGNQPQHQTGQSQTANATSAPATSTSATGPSVSEGSSTAETTSARGATTTTVSSGGAGGGGGSATATFGPFQIPLGTIPSFPNIGSGNTANVIVEASAPQISVANISTVFNLDDDPDASSGDSNDSTTMESSITVEASSVPEGRPPPSTTSSNRTQQPTLATTISGHFGAMPGTTSTFTFGPTTNVNVLPNVPGMPPGMLQNIIGSIINHQGRGNQPIQMNITRQTTGPQQAVVDLPLDGHLDQHYRAHFSQHLNATGAASERGPTSSTDASQQASPTTVDASTGTSSNASTNTSSSSEAATNTASVAAGTSRNSVNASVNTSNAGVGDGLHSNSSVGTGTDPGLGMNNQSTNTPQIHLSINGRGIPIALRPPQQGQQQQQQPNSGRGIPIALRPPQQGQQQQQQQQQQRAGPRQLHSHQHHFHPVPPGTGAMMNSVYADPYLSCNSHNYDTQSARSAFRALQARMRARGQQVPQANQQVPNLSTMVSGMFGNIIEQVGQVFSQGSRSSANTTGSNTTTTATSTTTNNSSSNTSAQQGQGSTVRGRGTTGTTTTSSNSGGNPSTQPPPFNPMEMFASMFGAPGARSSSSSAGHLPIDLGSVIGNLMQATRSPSAPSGGSSRTGGSGHASISPPSGTLADMFTYFRAQGDEQDSESPNVLVSLLETVAPHMGLADLFSLVTGNTRVIGQLRGPLRQFVAQQLANANDSVDTLVTSALDGMFPEIEHIQSLIQVRPGVNMAMSVRNCLQTHLRTIFTAIHSDSPGSDDEFGRNLYSAWMAMMAETIGLCIYCIQDGQTGFSNMVQRYMPRMTQGMNPAITIWMTTSLQDILASFHRNHPVSEAQVMAFVVRTDTTRPEEPAATAAIASEATRTPHQPDRPNISRSAPASSEPKPMDIVTASPSPQPPKAKAARTLPEEEEIFVDAQETFTSRPTHQPSASSRARPSTITTSSTASAATPAMGSQNQTSIKNGPGGSDNWQSVIPQEWIPVISQDVARQRDQRPQPPLSDAYLQGLPAKRRRMMTVEHAGEMGSMGRYLPSALTRAAQAARVEPISSEENLSREAADNLDLQAELEHEVAAVLETRITSDSDFSSERFPHAKEYFHKSRKH